MTAVPHDGISTRRLRESAGVIRSRVGSRLVRPSASRTPRAGSTPTARGAREDMATAQSVGAASAAALPTNALGINLGALSPTSGASSLRLVLAGRRVRLGDGSFVMLVLGLLTTILVALLLLNTALAENSFQLNGIRENARDLTLREQVLSGQLAAAESPIGLEKRARELGMVPGGSPVFLRLSDGQVLGQSTPAETPPAPEKPKKPKTPTPASPYAGEYPVGAGGIPAETPLGSGAASAGQGTSSGEVPAGGTGATGGFGAGTTVLPPVGGEQPVGVVRGTTR